jgi:hypothetical protein
LAGGGLGDRGRVGFSLGVLAGERAGEPENFGLVFGEEAGPFQDGPHGRGERAEVAAQHHVLEHAELVPEREQVVVEGAPVRAKIRPAIGQDRIGVVVAPGRLFQPGDHGARLADGNGEPAE